MTRREHGTIAGDILRALDAQSRSQVKPGNLTQLAARVNVAFDRLENYLEELRRMDLLTQDRVPRLTQRGRYFLERYLQWVRAQDEFGVSALPEAASVRAPALAPGEEALERA